MINAIFKPLDTEVYTNPAKQWDYGQILRIQGVTLPKAVEVHFGISGEENTVPSVGVTDGDHTDVEIPDGLLRQPNDLVAYVYIADVEKGNTVKTINIPVIARAKPAIPHTPEDEAVFREAIEAVNTAADRAEKAGQTATEAAGQAAEDAQQTAEDRKEVEKMVETVSDISEQVKKVEQLSQQAQDAATKAGKSEQAADGFKTQAESAKKDAEAAAVKTAEDKTAVENAKTEVLEVKTEVNADRTVVEQIKNEVEQLGGSIAGAVQSGVQEITQAGAAQKTAVEGAGTQAVENVENVQQEATEAVEIAKTEAVQVVQTEGTKQTGNVSAEGAKQIKEVQDKGAEVLQSIPENFATQMETKLNKQQGIENKGKVLVIGEDGNVVPEEVASGGGDGIAIVNTTSGESPLAIPDSAERVNKGFGLTGKTEQVQTTGKNLFDFEKVVVGLINFTDGSFSNVYYKYFTTDYIAIESGDYIISNNNNVGIQSYALYDINSKAYITGKAGNNKVNTLEKCFIRISFSTKPETDISSDPVSYAKKCDIQLEKGTTATPHEPYTGGKPSPSPEYPQEIVNAGRLNEDTGKYEIDVTINSGNLFKLIEHTSGYYVDKDGKVQIAKALGYSWTAAVNNLQKQSVTLHVTTAINTRYRLYCTDLEDTILYKYEDSSANTNDHSHTFNMPDGAKKIYVSVLEINSVEQAEITLNLGNVTLPYEPYKEQTLTLTSDRPITKWDRLVEQGGQIGWLYQSNTVVIDGSETWSSSNVPEHIYFTTAVNNKSGRINTSLCKTYKNNGEPVFNKKHEGEYNIYSDNPTNGVSDTAFVPPNETVTKIPQWKEWLNANPIEMLYKTKTTEFVPLPQSEQNAIRALKTYYPTTVITADGGELAPDIKVTYTADTKNYIDNKVSAKVASIIRQYRLNTANLLSLMPMETQAAMIENDTNNILENVEEMKHE